MGPISKGQAVQEEFLEKAVFAHVAKSFLSFHGHRKRKKQVNLFVGWHVLPLITLNQVRDLQDILYEYYAITGKLDAVICNFTHQQS